jgi:hypothetical protein
MAHHGTSRQLAQCSDMSGIGHSGHGRTWLWLDPVANDPAKEVNFCCRYRPSVEVAIEKLVQAVICIVRCLAVVFQPVIKHRPAGLEVRVIESMVRAGIDN